MQKTNTQILTNHIGKSQEVSERKISSEKKQSSSIVKHKNKYNLSRKNYYYNSRPYREALIDRQRALKLAVKHNFLKPVLVTLSGMQKHSKLKMLMFLINSSSHGHIRIGYEKLASILGIKKRQAITNMRYLLDHGFITKIEERHTSRNRLSNMYVVLDIFSDNALLLQLKNMYYDNKPQKKHCTLISNNKELLNYNSISTTNYYAEFKNNVGSAKSIGNILFNVIKNKERLRSACRVGTHRSDSQNYEADSNLRSETPERKGIEVKLSNEEKERIRNFITPDLKPSYLLFKDKNEHPNKYALLQEEAVVKIKTSSSMANYLERFKDKIVKE